MTNFIWTANGRVHERLLPGGPVPRGGGGGGGDMPAAIFFYLTAGPWVMKLELRLERARGVGGGGKGGPEGFLQSHCP